MTGSLDLGNLLAHLRLDDVQFTSGLKRAEHLMKSTADRFGQIGRTLTMRLTAPLIAAGTAAAKSFASFDDAMSKSVAIMRGMTPEIRKEMELLAETTSRKTVTSATELAKSYFYLASAGLDAEQSLAALRQVNDFAIAGFFDMAEATSLAADAQSALGLTVKDSQQNLINMSKVTDALVGANTLANATVRQFSLSLTSEAGAAMKAFNIPLEEGVAMLAAYADQGIKAEHAGAMYGRMLRLMMQSYNTNRGVWKQWNIEIYNSSGQLLSQAEIIGNMTKALQNLSTEQKIAALDQLGFQARSQQAILPLIGLKDRIQEYTTALQNMGGMTQQVAEANMKNFGAAIKIVWNNIVYFARDIGRILAPAITAVGEKIKQFTVYWDTLDTKTKMYIVGIAAVAAALGPLALSISMTIYTMTTFISVLVAVLSPIGLIIIAIIAFAAQLYVLRAAWEQNVMGIRDVLQQLLDLFQEGFEWLSNTVLFKFFRWFIDSFTDAFKTVRENFSSFVGDVAAAAVANIAFIKNIHKGLSAAQEAWATAYVNTYNKVEGKFAEFKNGVVDGFEVIKYKLTEVKEANIKLWSELWEATKAQFNNDINAFISMLKSKAPEMAQAIDELERNLKKAQEAAEGVGNAVSKWRIPDQFLDHIKNWISRASDIWNRMGEAATRALDDMSDRLTEFVMTGKMNFKGFADAVIADLIRIQVRALMARAVATFLPMVTGAFSGMFGGLRATTLPSTGGTAASVMVAHSGGIVGQSYFPTRSISAGMFNNAPRLHNGLNSSEFPAILEKGERVIPKDRTEKESQPVLIIKAWDVSDIMRNSKMIEGLISDALRKRTPLREAMKQYG